MRLVLSALILGAVSVTAFSLQNPLAHHPAQQPFAKPKHHPIDPFETFVNHFDSHRVATDTYLQTHLASLYPNRTMTVTQDSRFQLLAYAANAPDGNILVRQMDDVEILKRTVYINSPRRRDGDGKVVDMILFAGYEIAWGDKEFTAIVATWSEAYSSITQWHLFGTDEKAAHELIQACAAFNANVRNIVWVFEQGFWRYDRALWESIQQASWDDVVLNDTLKRAIQNDYRSFFKSEDIYKKLNVPWKRGLIFLGPPGNGKTISLKAIMKEVQVPLLYVKSFHTYAGDELGIRSVFAQARALAPCVLVLEDLDSLITNQNRAFFLNEVDGLEDNDGLLLIGSTNHFDRLDPALSSRPSRFDRKYNFPNPNKAERREYAVYWQDKLKDNSELDFPDELLDKFAEGTDKFSFAYMKEVFVSTLLIIAGQEPGEEVRFGDLLMDQVKKIKKDIEDGEQLLAIGGGVGGMIGGGHDQEGAGGAGGYPPEEAEMLRGAGVGVQVDAGQKVFGKRL